MSERILKLLAEETNLTTPGYVGANLLRLRNVGSVNYSVMIKDGSTITGSITIYPNEVIYIRKKSTETIETTASNNDVRCVKIAFGD